MNANLNHNTSVQEFDKKKKQADTQKAIARSTAINRARLQKIEARQHYMTQLADVCARELKTFARSKDKYQALLIDLIVQGCLKVCLCLLVSQCPNANGRIFQISARTRRKTKNLDST